MAKNSTKLGPGYKIISLSGPKLKEPEKITYSRKAERNVALTTSSAIILILVILIIREKSKDS